MKCNLPPIEDALKVLESQIQDTKNGKKVVDEAVTKLSSMVNEELKRLKRCVSRNEQRRALVDIRKCGKLEKHRQFHIIRGHAVKYIEKNDIADEELWQCSPFQIPIKDTNTSKSRRNSAPMIGLQTYSNTNSNAGVIECTKQYGLWPYYEWAFTRPIFSKDETTWIKDNVCGYGWVSADLLMAKFHVPDKLVGDKA